jgi:folylpolyglutamate synthase/dihydropteroate synthase
VVFASLRDKNIAVELPRIDRDVKEIVLTTFPSERAGTKKTISSMKAIIPLIPTTKKSSIISWSNIPMISS